MRRILILPSALFGELSASFLDRRSFKVRAAETPEEALRIASMSLPALIIFSSNLENTTAAEFCRQVRGVKKLRSTKLLMLTREAGAVSAESLARVQVDAHLIQPLDESALLNAVGALLDVDMRRAPRLRCELLAKVTRSAEPGGAATPIFANVLGLSETGLLLESECHLGIGEIVFIQFVVPERSLRVALRSMVLRADELQLHYGCEFLDSAPVDRDAIREFVERQLARREKAKLGTRLE